MRRDDAKRLIAALIRRRHNDAIRIKKLRKKLDFNIGEHPVLLFGLSGIGGAAIGAVLAKTQQKLQQALSIIDIRKGRIPEVQFVLMFKDYFGKGRTLAARFMEPDIWKGIGEEDYDNIARKVNAARDVKQLARLFPDHRYLQLVNAAYKEAKASGLY